jgi:hypothetical protein
VLGLHPLNLGQLRRRTLQEYRPGHLILSGVVVMKTVDHEIHVTRDQRRAGGVTDSDTRYQIGHVFELATKHPVNEQHVSCVDRHHASSSDGECRSTQDAPSVGPRVE